MISVVIPAFNEEKTISRVLESLACQDFAGNFEVIVVNNASTDETAAVAKTFEGPLNIRIIEESKKGRGAARAAGANSAIGDFILFTDADVILPTNWVSVLTASFLPGVVGVTGTALMRDGSRLTNAFFNVLQPLLTYVNRVFMRTFWLVGFSSAVLASAYKKSGGFNPDLNSMEDIDIACRVAKFGKIVLVRDCPVEFSGRRFRDGFLWGLLTYVPPFLAYCLRRKQVNLSDVR